MIFEDINAPRTAVRPWRFDCAGGGFLPAFCLKLLKCELLQAVAEVLQALLFLLQGFQPLIGFLFQLAGALAQAAEAKGASGAGQFV